VIYNPGMHSSYLYVHMINDTRKLTETYDQANRGLDAQVNRIEKFSIFSHAYPSHMFSPEAHCIGIRTIRIAKILRFAIPGIPPIFQLFPIGNRSKRCLFRESFDFSRHEVLHGNRVVSHTHIEYWSTTTARSAIPTNSSFIHL
jgi:hypothetical protein